jgi:hypothetical protein
MDHITNITIPRLDRERLTTASSAIAAAVFVYSVVRLMQKDKKPEGTREIPTPKSAYPYVGKKININLKKKKKKELTASNYRSPVIFG